MSTDAIATEALALPLHRERSFLRELERPSHVFHSFGPNWFAAVMGTGIVANAAAPLPFDWPVAKDLAIGPWALAVVLLVAISVGTVVHWMRHPERARGHISDAAMAPFYGCPPMALLTVGAGTLLVAPPLIGTHAAVVVDSVLWGLGAGMFGLSVLLAALTISLLWFRLLSVDAGPPRMVPTLWIVLGPLGQSVTAAGLLGSHAPELLKAPYGTGLEAFGVVYGLPVWGFAMAWLAIAGLITLRELRRGLPFSLTWWSFTFPVGTVVTGTSLLAIQTGAKPLAGLAVCLFALLLVAWAAAFVNTLRSAWTGAAFLPAP